MPKPQPSSLVADASGIIVLARVGRTDLLEAVFDKVMVPGAVAREIEAGPEEDSAKNFLASRSGLVVHSVVVPDLLREWGLGAGETEVLALASSMGGTALLDDKAARTCGRVVKVAVIGTLGLVLRAAMEGFVDDPRSLLDDIRQAGLRLSVSAIQAALASLDL